MSTITETQTEIPTGTWKADTVHSSVAFEVHYAVATFGGTVNDFEATLADGRLAGSARIESIETKDENLQRAPALPRVLRRRAPPGRQLLGRRSPATATTSRSTARSRSRASRSPPTSTGTIVGPAVDHYGTTRVGLEARRRPIDRTEFGINWNMPLPNGEPALSNEVTLKADLTLVAKAA